MIEFQCAVGRKIYSIKCREDDADKIKELATQLNQILNRNSLKYRGLSGDNLFLITSLELLDQLNLITDKGMSDNATGRSDLAQDAIISRHFAQILSDITDKINAIANDFEEDGRLERRRDVMEHITNTLFPMEVIIDR